MKDQARIVIIGGGIVGVNIAYHLAKAGCTDVILLEKDEIASGATAHAAGLVTQFATSQTLMQFRMFSIELYSELGLFEHVGSLRVASSPEQLKELQRSVSRAKANGMEVDVITPSEALKIMPQITGDSLYGAFYLPRDGHLDPYITTTTMAKLAKEMGVSIQTGVRVTGMQLSPSGSIQTVLTTSGPIRTENLVIAAGIWSPRVASMVGLNIPSTPVDHQHIALKAVPGHIFPHETPCLRDPDNLVYMREEAGGLVIGGYEPNPLARWVDGVPWEHGGSTVPGDMGRFEQLLEGAIRRLPFLDQAGIISLVCHPGAYTPDCTPMLGPMEGVRGLWIAAGMSLNGFGGAGGIGRLMAEWILEGKPSQDVYSFLATRFGNYYNNPYFATERTREGVKYYYRLRFPNDENEWARPFRVSPLHSRLQEQGAVFGEKFGWERVNFCQPGKPWRRAGADQREWGWTKPPYFERLKVEHEATREKVCLYDLTSFGKIELKGPGALPLLQRVTDSDMNKPVGSAIYTQFLNSSGGVQSDLTITRMGKDRFRVVTGSGFIANDLAWLQMNVHADDPEVEIHDITLENACIALWGPQARNTLQKVTRDDVSNQAFPYLTARTIDINGVKVLAQRVSYVGELGWELYIPNNRATVIWDALLEAGQEFGIEVGGYKVLDALRLEKGYRYYTADVTPLENPYEAGLGFCVHPDKGDFIGREAVLKFKSQGIKRKLCTFLLDGEDYITIYGGEAIYSGGKVVSRVRSGGFGYTIKRNIAYAYLAPEFSKAGTSLDIEIFDQTVRAEVVQTVLFDPKGEKLHA
jgi:4-methylaminobutanoate oxidase (formaldehyde-forming)